MAKKGTSKYNFQIGSVIGYNTILERITHKYLCQCSCGSSPRIMEPYLIIQCRKCAKCGNPRPLKENPNFKGYEEIRGDIVKKLNKINKSRGFGVTDITPEYLWDIYLKQNKKCILSDLNIEFNIPNKNFYGNYEQTASLDRINSSLGYFIGNVQWVHKDVNRMKNKYDLNYFLYLCKLISIHNDNLLKNIIDLPKTEKFN